MIDTTPMTEAVARNIINHVTPMQIKTADEMRQAARLLIQESTHGPADDESATLQRAGEIMSSRACALEQHAQDQKRAALRHPAIAAANDAYMTAQFAGLDLYGSDEDQAMLRLREELSVRGDVRVNREGGTWIIERWSEADRIWHRTPCDPRDTDADAIRKALRID
jgi:hypothetical protein